MSRYLITLVLIAAAGCTAPAHAANPPVTLTEAVRLASAQAPRLEAQDAAVAAAEAEASRAGALPDPMLMFGIENLPVTGGDAFDPTVEDMTMNRIGVRQEFPAAAKRKAQRSLALRQVDEARAQAAWLRVLRLSTRSSTRRKPASKARASIISFTRRLKPVPRNLGR